jgi:rRNA biogenesis protein RRP5
MAKRKTSTGTDKDASAVTIAAPTEENFPRGGASTLTPLEHREISNKVANDLFASVRILKWQIYTLNFS